MNFNVKYNQIIKQEFNISYFHQKLAIIAGSFRIPYSYDIDLVNYFLSFCDKVIIDISNTSKEKIDHRIVSKTNVDALAKLLSNITTSNMTLIAKIKNLQNKIETYTYEQLFQDINSIILLIDNKEIQQKLKTYISTIQKKIYGSIKYLNGKELTGEIIKQIFEICFDNLPVDIIISKQYSPVLDVINFVNNNCKDCEVYLSSLNNENQKNTTWKSLLSNFSSNNKIVEHHSSIKPTVSRQYILNNYNKIENNKLFNNLEDQKINKIRSLLNERF